MNKYMYMYMQNVIICLTYDTCTMCRYILSDEQTISIVLPEESVSWWCQWGPQGIYKGLSTRNAIIVQAKYFWRSLVENTDACSAEQVLESTCQNSIFLLHKFWQALISSRFSKQASGYIKKKSILWLWNYLPDPPSSWIWVEGDASVMPSGGTFCASCGPLPCWPATWILLPVCKAKVYNVKG